MQTCLEYLIFKIGGNLWAICKVIVKLAAKWLGNLYKRKISHRSRHLLSTNPSFSSPIPISPPSAPNPSSQLLLSLLILCCPSLLFSQSLLILCYPSPSPAPPFSSEKWRPPIYINRPRHIMLKHSFHVLFFYLPLKF